MYFASIQILRGLSALAVVVYHAFWNLGWLAEGDFDRNFLDAGVDVFFVISGFVMVISTDGRRDDPVGFLRARAVRIVPLFWIATAAAVVRYLMLYGVLPPIDEAMKSLLFIPYTASRTGEMLPLVAAGWTLTYEVVFYALFAITLALALRLQIAVLGVVFVALVLLRPFVGGLDATLFRLTSPLLFEFLAGMILAATLKWWTRTPVILGVVAIVAAIAAGILATTSTNLPRFVAQGAPAIAIVAGFIVLEQWMRTRYWAPGKVLGDASYSVYLFHTFFMTLAPVSLLGGWAWAAVVVPLATAGGIVIHFTVEKPLMRLFRQGKKGTGNGVAATPTP